MNRYVMGDIHGELDKLLQCLRGVNFDYENDWLMQLGDVVDRGPDSYECVEELLKIKNLVAMKGNHDDLFFKGLHSGVYALGNQGCKETLESYIKNTNPDLLLYHTSAGIKTGFEVDSMPIGHYAFFKNQLPYFIDDQNNCFVHGGFNRHIPIEDQGEDIFLWDRELWLMAMGYRSMKNTTYGFKIKSKFKEVFIGHTPTQYFGCDGPMSAANIWNIDTGCGKGGELTIMNINTKEYYQSI